MAYKDEFSNEGVHTTFSSAILSEVVPQFDATAAGRLSAEKGLGAKDCFQLLRLAQSQGSTGG